MSDPATSSTVPEPQASGDSESDPNRLLALIMTAMFVLTLPAIMLAIVALRPPLPENPWVEQAQIMGLDPSQLEHGAAVYRMTCAVCHGKEANGIPRLGKPLRNSAFVQEHTDDELFHVISYGRSPRDPENTTGSTMPPRAGDPLIGDTRLRSVVYYLRTLQDPEVEPASLDAWIVARLGDSESGMFGAGSDLPGHDVFVSSCSACHGQDGEGVDGLGKPLGASEFVNAQSDEALIKFIKSGRPIWDAENTTGIDMPPKGGNPAISDEQLEMIVKYIRSLHETGDGE